MNVIKSRKPHSPGMDCEEKQVQRFDKLKGALIALKKLLRGTPGVQSLFIAFQGLMPNIKHTIYNDFSRR